MREILFRGKGNPKYNEGNWYEGYLTHDTENYRIYIPFGIKGYYTMTVLEETVGQFTGLTDKKGRKIFEGDIVDILTEDEEIGVVKYDDNDACFYVSAGGFIVDFSHIYGKDTEIIGNIHDNPELLEQEE